MGKTVAKKGVGLPSLHCVGSTQCRNECVARLLLIPDCRRRQSGPHCSTHNFLLFCESRFSRGNSTYTTSNVVKDYPHMKSENLFVGIIVSMVQMTTKPHVRSSALSPSSLSITTSSRRTRARSLIMRHSPQRQRRRKKRCLMH